MALAVFLGVNGGEPVPGDPTSCDVQAAMILCGTDVPGGFLNQTCFYRLGPLDGVVDIRRKQTQAMKTAAAEVGVTLTAADCIVPNMDRGLL